MVSANPTGPITVAAARNGAYGDSVARLLAFAGHEVEREYYYNDAGAQMERFRASVDAARRGEEPPEDGYQRRVHRGAGAGRRRSGAARCSSGSRRRWSASGSTSTAGRGRASSSSGCPSPAAARHVRAGRRRLGALVRVRRRGGPRPDPLRGRRRRPTARPTSSTSRTSSSAGFDRAIYVLGADHHGTRNWYAARRAHARLRPERVEVLLYQLVHLTRGGEATKMSKRRGDVVFLDEFLDEIGVDAARWYLVSRGHDQTIEIDVDLAAERSQKNPVYYVQYAHARIAGDPPERRGRRAGRCAPAGARRRGARADQAAGRVPARRRRGDASGAARTRSRTTRSASRTTSTASTTSTTCSAPTRRLPARPLHGTQAVIARASISSVSRRPSGCNVTGGFPGKGP